MKRLLATVALLACLGLLLKIRGSESPNVPGRAIDPSSDAQASSEETPGREHAIDQKALAETLARHDDPADRERIARLFERFGPDALTIEQTDGIDGLRVLEVLDHEARFLYETDPSQFRVLREAIDDEAIAQILRRWRNYFGLIRADQTGREILINEIDRLPIAARRLAADHPELLPLILTEPEAVVDLLAREGDDPKWLATRATILQLVDLSQGSTSLRQVLRILDQSGDLALEAFQRQGMLGLAAVGLYGEILREVMAGSTPSLDDTLIMILANLDDVDDLLQTRRPETLAADLRHIEAVGLTEIVGDGPGTLRLAITYGSLGEAALRTSGPDAALVVFDQFVDPTRKTQAVRALAEHGPEALVILTKYGADEQFLDLLDRDGPAIIPPIARADAAGLVQLEIQQRPTRAWDDWVALGILYLNQTDGQEVLDAIAEHGLESLAAIDPFGTASGALFPLYDLLHLVQLVGQDHSSTRSALSRSVLDGCLRVLQTIRPSAIPETNPRTDAASTLEARSTVRNAARALGRDLSDAELKATYQESVRDGRDWLAVRQAGGIYALLVRMPQVLDQLDLRDLNAIAQPLCRKAGIQLSPWSPTRYWADGREEVDAVPTQRGLGYLALGEDQLALGCAAFHKMGEHLASRRPRPMPSED